MKATLGRLDFGWLMAGCVVVAVALLSPLDAAAHDLFSAHMAQHLSLIFLAAPLFALGLARVGLPRFISGVVAIWSLQMAAMWAWHLPSLYTSALYTDALHSLEHASFIGAGVLFWHALYARHPAQRLGYPQALLLVFLTAVGSGALGAILTFASSPLYPVHRGGALDNGLTLLEDQQLAGLVMWIPIGVVYLAAACVLFVKWLRAMEAETDRTEQERMTAR